MQNLSAGTLIQLNVKFQKDQIIMNINFFHVANIYSLI